MSGAHAKWTPERRAKQAEVMRRLRADPMVEAKRLGNLKMSDYNRLTKRRLMRTLNQRLAEDDKLSQRWLLAVSAANGTAQRREASSHILREIRRRPEHATRQAAARRGLHVPDELLALYHVVRRKVGADEARRIIAAEIRRSP